MTMSAQRPDISATVQEMLATHAPGQQSLIPLLQEIQDRFGYVPEAAVAELARAIGISENEIYGVTTFYTRFRFTPPAEHTIHVCQGTACHVRGGRHVLGAFERELGVRPGEITEDGRFGLERVFCMGCCALSPVGVVDDQVNVRLSPEKVRPLLDQYGLSNGQSNGSSDGLPAGPPAGSPAGPPASPPAGPPASSPAGPPASHPNGEKTK